jgi:branched-chain amino acid transport system permease protein
VRRVFLASWALAAVLAGVAGVLFASTSIVTPELAGIAWAAFPAIILGGLDSIEGAIVGGLLIGILQGFTTTFLGGEVTDVVTYGLLLVVLLVRPSGLFGTTAVTRL